MVVTKCLKPFWNHSGIISMTYFSPFQGVLYLYGGLRRAPQPYFGIFLEFWIILRPDSMKKCIFKTDRPGLVYYGGNLWKLWSNDQNLGSWWWSIQWLGSLGWRRPWSRRCPSSRWWRPECSSPGPFNHHDSIFMILDTWTRRAVPVFCWSKVSITDDRSPYLDSNDRENFHCDPVELVKAAPRAGLGQALDNISLWMILWYTVIYNFA